MYSKFNYILGKKNKSKIIIFIFLNIIYFLLEFFSLASLPLFVSFIINPNFILEKLNIIFKDFFFKELNFNSLLLLLSSFIIIVFFLKNIFLIFLTYLQNSFLKKLKVDLSEKIFSYYLNSSYLYHLSNNPSKLSRNISDEIQNLYNYFFHLSGLLRESLVIFIIFTFLAFVNFYITSITAVFLLITCFLYIKLVKPFLRKKAVENQKMRQTITQTIYEVFGSIKDIKVLNKEDQIINFFKKNVNIYEKNLLHFSYFDKLPKIFLELSSVLIICLICIFYLGLGQDYKILIPTLSLLAISFMRFAPAFSSVTQNIYYIKIYEPTLDLIFLELKYIEDSKIHDLKINKKYSNNFNVNLKNEFLFLNNITFSYPGREFVPINNISMSIKEGGIVGITGETGAGKSTLFHL